MSAKTSAPVQGFNHNLKFGPRIYHVQTEDSGLPHAHYITHLFVGGNIVASAKTSYAEKMGEPDLPKVVRGLMETQHKSMVRRLVAGEFNDKVEQFAPHYEPGVLASGESGPAAMNAAAFTPGAATALAGKPVPPPARPPSPPPVAAKPAPPPRTPTPRQVSPPAAHAPAGRPTPSPPKPPPAHPPAARPPTTPPGPSRLPGGPLPATTRMAPPRHGSQAPPMVSPIAAQSQSAGPAAPTEPALPPLAPARRQPVATPLPLSRNPFAPEAGPFADEQVVELPADDIPTLFAEELISEKSLDEVILAFLSADLEQSK